MIMDTCVEAVCSSGCKSPTLEEEVLIVFLRRCEFDHLTQVSGLVPTAPSGLKEYLYPETHQLINCISDSSL
ncbi:hypothetical protein AV530_011141 [Patagioenas fasciata monilis]|uniref:Uncharacterized protein n=1 Tax=Patagioenas fasciata monilis TaxID=372326 RepID=A0A1V4KCT9_PATFA|nr:hypothetical protein AV530_011141 [Patagioenas fasciata monilis]